MKSKSVRKDNNKKKESKNGVGRVRHHRHAQRVSKEREKLRLLIHYFVRTSSMTCDSNTQTQPCVVTIFYNDLVTVVIAFARTALFKWRCRQSSIDGSLLYTHVETNEEQSERASLLAMCTS